MTPNVMKLIVFTFDSYYASWYEDSVPLLGHAWLYLEYGLRWTKKKPRTFANQWALVDGL